MKKKKTQLLSLKLEFFVIIAENISYQTHAILLAKKPKSQYPTMKQKQNPESKSNFLKTLYFFFELP